MKVGYLFPGQGSQRVGMGKELSDNFAIARKTLEEADDVLGFRLSRLCFDGPDEELRLTTNTQPALLAVTVAAWRVFESECSLRAEIAAGHSLGEYGALVAAGVLDFASALSTVRERGRLMQEACPPGQGGMAALIGLGLDEVKAVCAEASTDAEFASPANLNAADQTVIAGHSGAVRRALSIAKERGARASFELRVSAPFHCALMQPARQGLTPVLERLTVRPFRCGVIANVTAEVNRDPERVRPLLTEQVTAPVRWAESMQRMGAEGVDIAFEFGCGRVLTGLMRRASRAISVKPIEDLASLKAGCAGL